MLKKYLSTDQNKLYDLIWSRALSSQMESAKFDRNTITITSDNNDTICKASGSVLKFDGFLKFIIIKVKMMMKIFYLLCLKDLLILRH